MSKLKTSLLLLFLIGSTAAFSQCNGDKYKDCRCKLLVNNGFQNVPDVTAEYCCKYKCAGMGFDGDSRCCIGAEQGKTWVDGSCKTPCSTVTCPSGYEKNGTTYGGTTAECCKKKQLTWKFVTFQIYCKNGMPDTSNKDMGVLLYTPVSGDVCRVTPQIDPNVCTVAGKRSFCENQNFISPTTNANGAACLTSLEPGFDPHASGSWGAIYECGE